MALLLKPLNIHNQDLMLMCRLSSYIIPSDPMTLPLMSGLRSVITNLKTE